MFVITIFEIIMTVDIMRLYYDNNNITTANITKIIDFRENAINNAIISYNVVLIIGGCTAACIKLFSNYRRIIRLLVVANQMLTIFMKAISGAILCNCIFIKHVDCNNADDIFVNVCETIQRSMIKTLGTLIIFQLFSMFNSMLVILTELYLHDKEYEINNMYEVVE